jgi:cytochrome c-type biogenesis protein CcmH/NrfG
VTASERPGATAAPGDLEGVEETYLLSADRWHLEDEAEFLRRSLDDAKSELEAGDLGRADYDVLCRRDEARLGAVEAALRVLDAEDEAEAEAESRAPRRRGRWLLVVGIAALVAATTLLAFDLASPRAPGQPITGSLKVNKQQQIETQLAQASTLLSENSTAATQEALTIYAHVLSEDPRQPQALAETGWLEWEAGVHSDDKSLRTEGTTLVRRSLAVEPDDYAAHLFLGTIDFEGTHDTAAAIVQYRAFLAEGPPAKLIASAAPFLRAAYSAAGLAIPAEVPLASG